MNSSATKILLVEDDPNLGQLLQEYLEIKGFETTLARDGEKAFTYYQQNHYDLCIFDVMLPKKDGFSLAKEIRASNKQIPIIFLTAKSLKEDTLEGLRIGADDYMTKPFSMEELLLRMKAILRRSGQSGETTKDTKQFTIGQYTFDYEFQTLAIKNQSVKLTSKESELLRLLCLNLNHTLERSIALKHIWQNDTYFNARSMDVYITKLRKYLKDDPSIEIVNVHGTGYKLMVLNSLDLPPVDK
ncbi:response regulator transcription factor [Rhodocytophaga aerolata]|uniref:Response regulator transcription factor n=1 Tax=Rhodocytophaga aerolata TaxID=455078 RepID=A0ABT8R6F1_9BACT|nr:response regulator transcription factor [Rhodocytophaga aerolata]MDO1446788.1 response regulator transcription factor [Rhodocytophaga aerolata]